MPAKILLCLDTDPQPSVFDAVVAVDAGVDQLFRHSNITPDVVRDLVYGAIFTRSPAELKNTAIFVGGSDVTAGEKVLATVDKTCFGPMRVSAMLDSNGSNTTAAAAVIAAGRHVDLSKSTVAVLAGTGSVGKRILRMLADDGANIRLGSRSLEHAERVAEEIRQQSPTAKIECLVTTDDAGLRRSLDGANVVIASGPPGVELLPQSIRDEFPNLAVAIDLNAVPPLGIAGIEVGDKRKEQGRTICYGAIGVGGTKMKIHRAAIQKLFTTNDLVLDAVEIYELGKELDSAK
ncbi:NADP-dependent methylenetetrahydromethanopterin/methylenetetrahydrofolate dehydrogenase [Aeoliella sp. SH292]|uniref:NADP-dependent methylenetetrahydromethanopterin/methylenetetrahydrofolate dehydrogenase n=1 Tax=Aeoliella sp. SH292 TaxID=3454464 RepID=UPI003F948FCA